MEQRSKESGLAKVPENELLRRAVEVGLARVRRADVQPIWPKDSGAVARLDDANDLLAQALRKETCGVRVLPDEAPPSADGFGAVVRRRTKGEQIESLSFYVIHDHLVRDVLSVVGAAVGVVLEPWTGVPKSLSVLHEVFQHFVTIHRDRGQGGLIEVYEAMLATAGGTEGRWPSLEEIDGNLEAKGRDEILDALRELEQLGVIEVAYEPADRDGGTWRPVL